VRVALGKVFAGLDEPGGDVVERAAGAAEAGDSTDLGALFVTLILGASEGRIAEDIGAPLRRENAGPIGFKSIGGMNVG
jgi:hypothetical protein